MTAPPPPDSGPVPLWLVLAWPAAVVAWLVWRVVSPTDRWLLLAAVALLVLALLFRLPPSRR